MTGILSGIGSVITAVLGWITSIVGDVSNLFYDTTASTPTFTFAGVLLLVSFGLSMVWCLINFIRGLVRRG